jgi:type IV secretion system protein VirD4
MTRGTRIVFSIVAVGFGLLAWAIAYALLLQFIFHDGRVLKQTISSDPFTPFLQFYAYSTNPLLRQVALLSGIPAVIVTFLAIWLSHRSEEQPFGDAAFQNRQMLRQGKWFRKHGKLFGAFGGKLLRVDDDRHHMIIGPTRSGKGAGYVIPNALTHRGSMIVNDLKGEIYALTAGHRARTGNRVFLFSPGNEKSHRYNPFDFIRPGTGERTTDIQNMSQIMVPKGEGDNAVWQGLSQQLLAGVISYIHESDFYQNRRNFCEVNSFFATGMDLQKVLQKIIAVETYLSKFTVESFRRYISLNEKAARSALIEIDNALRPFQNERIAAATMVTDLDLASIKHRPTSIYLAPNVNDVELLKPLLVLFIQQTLELLTREQDPKALPVYFLLDEFRQLKKMTEITSKLPYVASYNIKFAFIIQDLKNLDEIYGETTRHSMLGNCGYQLVLGANDSATAKYVSEALGKTTATYWTESRAIEILGFNNRSKMQQKRERDLMMPQEIRQLPPEDMILLAEGQAAIRAKKIRYFADRSFRASAQYALKHQPPVPQTDLPQFLPVPATLKSYDAHIGKPKPNPAAAEAKVETNRPAPKSTPRKAQIAKSAEGAATLRNSVRKAETEVEAEAKSLAAKGLIDLTILTGDGRVATLSQPNQPKIGAIHLA